MTETTSTAEKTALAAAHGLRDGLLAWKHADPYVEIAHLAKAFRDNWDRRIGKIKFGGVWSIPMARANLAHPASTDALNIPRTEWRSETVTIEHAIPVKVFFPEFLEADSRDKMSALIEAYHVAVVTKEENLKLRTAGLSAWMPAGWTFWRGDPKARWQHVGIEIGVTS